MASPRDPTQFTRESAERIANVVRAAELTPRAGRPLSFDRVDDPPSRKVFRIATFTGAWPKGTDRVVTFKYQPTNTASVTNLFWPLDNLSVTLDCAVARDGTAWFLIDVPLRTHNISVIDSTEWLDVVTDVSFDAESCELQKETQQIEIVQSTSTVNVLVIEM